MSALEVIQANVDLSTARAFASELAFASSRDLTDYG